MSSVSGESKIPLYDMLKVQICICLTRIFATRTRLSTARHIFCHYSDNAMHQFASLAGTKVRPRPTSPTKIEKGMLISGRLSPSNEKWFP